nr:MAG TPA: hypothetical protein [Caudoviricetes sp.]
MIFQRSPVTPSYVSVTRWMPCHGALSTMTWPSSTCPTQ